MALRVTQRRLSLYTWYLNKFWRKDIKHPTPMTKSQKVEPGYHWLEKHYVPTPWELFYWNVCWFPMTGEVLVGKDWRNNLFFIKHDPAKGVKHHRFARFVEGWEMNQDYDTDDLWRKWLDFRMATPPTPQQCARLHKYQEEKYSIKEAGLQHLYEQEMQDPMSHRIRRYQEYVDQKWDVRRSRQIQKGTLGQKWLVKKSNSPDIRDKYYYTRWQAIWESKLFMQIDLLRPPRRQRVWKLEDDYRAVEAMNKIDNPDYKMNPFETTRQERYLSSPSHVAGRAVPTSVTKVEKAFDASKLPPEPVGELRMRITNENPIYGMSSDAEYQEWFADQRKQLIVARAELEQMKRDGFRPDEVGGDLDPYTAARPIDDYKEERRKRTEMLDRARDERQQLEAKKKGALQKMLGTDLKREYLASVAHKGPEEAVVYTKVRGKITEGESKRYLNEKHKLPETRSASLPATAIDDDSENMGEEMEGIRSVFGKKGTGLYSSKVGGRQSTRPDDASPDKTPEK